MARGTETFVQQSNYSIFYDLIKHLKLRNSFVQ